VYLLFTMFNDLGTRWYWDELTWVRDGMGMTWLAPVISTAVCLCSSHYVPVIANRTFTFSCCVFRDQLVHSGWVSAVTRLITSSTDTFLSQVIRWL